MEREQKLVIYTDGGARSNPGPAALGVVIGDKHYNEYLGRATNNEAEYYAVIFALQKAKQLLGKATAKKTEIEINTDSELIYKQLDGKYKIKETNLQQLFIHVWNAQQDFKKVTYKLVPREENKQADRLVNEALDKRDRGPQRLL